MVTFFKLPLPALFVLLFCLTYQGAGGFSARAAPLRVQTPDEAAASELAQKYFAAFAKEEVEALKLLWAAKSPEFEPTLKSLAGLFAALDKIEVKNLRAVKFAAAEGGRARLRVYVEMAAVVAKTGEAYPGFGKGHRDLELVSEGGAWKVWHEDSAEDELATRYVKAATDEERQALLAQNTELVSEDLQRRIERQAYALFTRGNYAAALPVFRLSLGLAERINYQPGMALAINRIGLTQRLLGNQQDALEAFERSLAIYQKIGDKEGGAKVLNNLGLLYYAQSDYPRALDYYRKSLAIFEELKIKWAIASTFNSLGNVYNAQGDNTRALEYYEKGLTLSQEINDQKTVANSLNTIGNMYGEQGNYPLALSYLERALEILRGRDDKDGVAMMLTNIGALLRRQGDYARSLDYSQQGLKLYQEMGAKSYIAAATTNIGIAHSSLGNYEQALAHFRLGLEMFEALGEKSRVATVLTNMAGAYQEQGNHAQAILYADRASEMAKQLGRTTTYAEARTTAGKSLLALKQPEVARRAFEAAIAATEELRENVAGGEQERQRFFEERITPYHEMVVLLASQNNAAESLAYAERAKARVLLDVLSGGRINITKAMTREEQEREVQLSAELNALNTRLASERRKTSPDESRLEELGAQLRKARLEREAFQSSLYARHPELKAQRGEAQPLKLEEAGALLADADGALLEFVVTDDKVFLFVLTKAQGPKNAAVDLKVYALGVGAKDLGARAESFRKQLAGRDLGYKESARVLYELLLAPAGKQLEGKRTLTIVPDATLWNLPFQALLTPQNRHLIEHYAISYAPSLTVLREMSRPRPNPVNGGDNSTLLAFGNPVIAGQTATRVKTVLMGEELFPLPEAEKQVNTLAELYGTAQSRVYTGAGASEDKAKAEAGNYRVLQFATHSILNDTNPMYSQIVLSQPVDGREDGLLEAWEMMNMSLRADLVVLSACETARGRVGAGEGVIGMTWALFVAGSPTTVVSQWKVESASTTELMVEFHKNLRAGLAAHKEQVSKAQALRQAALKLLRSEQYRHPFYWAGFVVVGKAR